MKKLNRDFPASDIYLPRTGSARICRAPPRLPGRNNTKSGMSYDERHTARKSGGPDGSIPSSAVASVVAESAPVVPLRFRTGHVDRDDLAFEFGLVQSVDSRPALSFVGHLDEAESSRTTGFAVRNDVSGRHVAVSRE